MKAFCKRFPTGWLCDPDCHNPEHDEFRRPNMPNEQQLEDLGEKLGEAAEIVSKFAKELDEWWETFAPEVRKLIDSMPPQDWGNIE